jgi:predicted AAA+ superfamily ATPase
MIRRFETEKIESALKRQAAVVLLGPRQVGKTTLALTLAEGKESIYLDLENPVDQAKLSDPRSYLEAQLDRLVILDEIHRAPGLFPILRGLIDEARRRGGGKGMYLLLGSASMELMKQSGESLAGRVSYIELPPLGIRDLSSDRITDLWVRGGFPDSLLATDSQESFYWRLDMIRTYLEREIPQLGPRIPASTLRRFWTMLAHQQGSLHNASRLAASLEVSSPTIGRYTDLFVDLLLARRLKPYHVNVQKRLVKSPKIYLRDSGWLHALLGLDTLETLLGHPVLGGSWEGFVIEQLLNAAPPHTVPGFYRTSGGAEADLVLELPGGTRWVIEIKRSPASRPTRGFHEARKDVEASRSFLVHSGTGRFPVTDSTESIGLADLIQELTGDTPPPHSGGA